MSLPFAFTVAAALFAATTVLSAQQTLTLRGELDEGRSTGCYYCAIAAEAATEG